MAILFRRTRWLGVLLHFYWRFQRGLTVGVRGMVLDNEGRVFLIKHSYVDGWHLPGGGVEVGETMLEALRRELMEEGSIELTGDPVLHAIYFNPVYSRRDQVALYVIREYRQRSAPVPDLEIVGHGFFPVTALPEGTTPGTRARLAEVLDGVRAAEVW
jgi:8-oxo-dGTP pyrophosphatase MutT (NUDIX family)